MENDAVLVQLARRVVDGDSGALGALLRELEPMVVRTARLIVGSGSWAAEDAAQDALLDVARGIAAFATPRRHAAWAVRIATTRALKVARRERLISLRRATLVDDVQVVSEPSGRRAAR